MKAGIGAPREGMPTLPATTADGLLRWCVELCERGLDWPLDEYPEDTLRHLGSMELAVLEDQQDRAYEVTAYPDHYLVVAQFVAESRSYLRAGLCPPDAHSFEFAGQRIYDPLKSPCGRLEVDPFEFYGTEFREWFATRTIFQVEWLTVHAA